MANSNSAGFNEVTPLSRVSRDGLQGHAGSKPGVSIVTLESLAIVQVFSAKGKTDRVASSLSLPTEAGMARVSEAYTAIPLSPGQWMLHADTGRDGSLCRNLRDKLGADGYVSEQSHGRLIIRLSGSHARQVMQKGCRLDLHPSVAKAGFCAQTTMAQTGVIIHQRDDSPSYDLMVYSGFAQSFWHWLTESAAEFGFEVIDPS